MEFSDLPLFSGVPELVAKMVDPNLPDVPSRERVAAFLEAGGWLRATAGDGDFDAACNAVAEVIRLGRGLYVWGAAGCGKSRLVRAVTRVTRLFTQHLPLDDPEYAEWLDTAAHPGWADGIALGQNVVLDDLGAEDPVSAFGVRKERAVEFVSRYYARGRGRLFITTNLDGDTLLERYGARFASRVKACCVGLHLKGPDKRTWNGKRVENVER